MFSTSYMPNTIKMNSTCTIFSDVGCNSDSSYNSASMSSSGSSTDDLTTASRHLQLGSHSKADGNGRMNLTDLRHFPSELSDPVRLLLVSCTDQPKAELYACRDCKGCGSQYLQHVQPDGATTCHLSGTVWALSFHHRYAFCTGCGKSAGSAMPAKKFAQIFVSAALAYVECVDKSNKEEPRSHYVRSKDGWWVGADSSCTIRVINASGADACSCGDECGNDHGDEEINKISVWAVSSVYSHAFCISCGSSADGSTLLSLLLTVRFGGKKLIRRRSCHLAVSTSGKS